MFLNVDLYLPTKRSLSKIYEYVCDGGIILVDDVHNNYGAEQAYIEFCDDLTISPTVVGNKCGIIRK